MTKSHEGYVRRLAFEITEEQQRKLNIYLSAHGTKKQVYSALTRGLIRLFDAGEVDTVLGAVYKGIIGPKELLGVKSDVGTEVEEEDSAKALSNGSEDSSTNGSKGADAGSAIGVDS